MRKLQTTLIFCFFILNYTGAQTSLSIDLQKNSWLAIKGTTNVVSFKLMHSGEKLLGKTINIVATQNKDKIYLSQNKLSIQVKNFESDNRMALRDFLKLIKSDRYPTLEAQLNYISTTSPVDKNSQYTNGNAFVSITITGETKQYHIPVRSTQHDEFISIDGSKRISIRDFGLEPPVEMFGLIKVSEWINIEFHMVCKLKIENEKI